MRDAIRRAQGGPQAQSAKRARARDYDLELSRSRSESRTLRSRTSGSCSASGARRARSRASRARDRAHSQIGSSHVCWSERGSRRKSAAGRRCEAAAHGARASISRNQPQSAAISRNQPQSAAIGRNRSQSAAHHSAHLTTRAPVAQVPSQSAAISRPSQRAHLSHKCHRCEDAWVERLIGLTVDAIQVDSPCVGAVIPSVDAI